MNAILLWSSPEPYHHVLVQIWDCNCQLSVDSNAGSESERHFSVPTVSFTGQQSWGSSVAAPSFTALLCQVEESTA